ncbi:MAG: hypothetical protein AB1631_29565, partial [Acidobacteriota bacterium]
MSKVLPKKIARAGLVLLMLFSSIDVLSQEPEKQPSLEETTKWLQEKLMAYGKHYRREPETPGTTRAYIEHSYILNTITFDGCTLDYTRTETKSPGLTFQYKIHLTTGDLDPSKVSIEEKFGCFWIVLSTTDGKNTIRVARFWGSSSRGAGVPVRPESVSSATIHVAER